MSERSHFEIVCPNNHDQTVKYTESEFEALLSSDTLVFHCNTCDANWSPSGKEIAQIRKQLRTE
jgi:hypothetical protein